MNPLFSPFMICSIWIGIFILPSITYGQEYSGTKMAIGLSAPELAHLGLGIDISKSNQIGITVE